MGDKTGIEWTDATWNPTTGCDKVSAGCDHCYAMTLAPRLKAMGSAHYQTDGDPETSGPGFGLSMHPDGLDKPIRWQRSRRIFVNSMSDLFHKDVTPDFIAQVFAVMMLAPHHTFQVLTKRPARMRSLLNSGAFELAVVDHALRMINGTHPDVKRIPKDVVEIINAKVDEGLYGDVEQGPRLPLPNVWLGTSVEDQKWADIRIPLLLQVPAAVRFLSMEPLIGPVTIQQWIDPERDCNCQVPLTDGAGQHAASCGCVTQPDLGWVIVGGESGPGARPMHPDWATALRDQSAAAGVPFLFKQWGDWHPAWHDFHNKETTQMEDGSWMVRLGKKAGRELDGQTHDGYPG